MNKYTHEEIEAANYEIWIMSGGPAKLTENHRVLATEALTVLDREGWEIIKTEMKKPFGHDAQVIHAVMRKPDGQLVDIRWQASGNGYWMEKMPCGGWGAL